MQKIVEVTPSCSELTTPEPVSLSVESVWVIGSRAEGSMKEPRPDSDIDVLFVLGPGSSPEILRLMNELPEAVKRYHKAGLSLSGSDTFGAQVWEAVAGERGVAYLREYGQQLLSRNKPPISLGAPIDVFVTAHDAAGACVRLTWQALPEDDDQAIRWEGLGYLSLGESWQQTAQKLF